MTRNNAIDRVKFRAAIDPSTNDAAENELQKEISKEKFEKVCFIVFMMCFVISYVILNAYGGTCMYMVCIVGMIMIKRKC